MEIGYRAPFLGLPQRCDGHAPIAERMIVGSPLLPFISQRLTCSCSLVCASHSQKVNSLDPVSLSFLQLDEIM